jgi:hypothetical protein
VTEIEVGEVSFGPSASRTAGSIHALEHRTPPARLEIVIEWRSACVTGLAATPRSAVLC